MKCALCEQNADILHNGDLCSECDWAMNQFFGVRALLEFIERNRQKLREWMKEWHKEVKCMTCEYGVFSQDGSWCKRGKKECPQGYEEKPSTDKIDVMLDTPILEKSDTDFIYKIELALRKPLLNSEGSLIASKMLELLGIRLISIDIKEKE